MQLKLETNLPVIFLTLLVIAIVVLGYLELKKLTERVKVIEYLNTKNEDKEKTNQSINTKGPSDGRDTPPKEDTVFPITHPTSLGDGLRVGEEEVQGNFPIKNMRVEEWQMNNEKDYIINTLNRKEEYTEEVDEEEDGRGQPFMEEGYDPSVMIYEEMNEGNRDIEEDDDGLIEEVGDHDIGNIEEVIEEVLEEVIEEVVEDDEDDEDNEDDEDDEGDEIDLKGISEEDDFSKNKIVVDESFSVNDLKKVCKNLGLQSSGNKTTLINRIMDYQ